MAISKSNAQNTVLVNYFEGLRAIPDAYMQGVDYRTDDEGGLRHTALIDSSTVESWDGSSDPTGGTVDTANALDMTYSEYILQTRIGKRKGRHTPGLAEGAAKAAGFAVANKMADLVASVFNNAFTTETVVDTKALIASDHTVSGGGTRSNLISSAFDRTMLMAMIKAAREWVTYGDRTYDLADAGWYLYVPPALEEDVIEILGSAVSSSEMQSNAANGYGITPIVWSKLGAAAGGSDTEVFLVSKAETPIRVWNPGDGPDFDYTVDQDNKSSKITVDFAFAADAGPQPDGIFGGGSAV